MNGLICCITGGCDVGFGIPIQHPSARSKSMTVVLFILCLRIPYLPILQLPGQLLKALFFSVLQLNCEMKVKGWIERCSSNISNFLSLLKQRIQSTIVYHDQS